MLSDTGSLFLIAPFSSSHAVIPRQTYTPSQAGLTLYAYRRCHNSNKHTIVLISHDHVTKHILFYILTLAHTEIRPAEPFQSIFCMWRRTCVHFLSYSLHIYLYIWHIFSHFLVYVYFSTYNLPHSPHKRRISYRPHFSIHFAL